MPDLIAENWKPEFYLPGDIVRGCLAQREAQRCAATLLQLLVPPAGAPSCS